MNRAAVSFTRDLRFDSNHCPINLRELLFTASFGTDKSLDKRPKMVAAADLKFAQSKFN